MSEDFLSSEKLKSEIEHLRFENEQLKNELIEIKALENKENYDLEKYKNIFNHSPLGIFHYNENGVITDCNDYFVQIIGSTKSLLIGLPMFTALKDKKLVKEVKKSLTTGEGHYEDFYRSVTANKTTPVRILFKGIKNTEMKLTGGLGLVEDISERYFFENALKQNEEKFRMLFENAADAIIVGNSKGEIIEINEGFTKITGYAIDEIYGKHISFLFSEEILKEKPLRFDLLNTGQSVIFEREILSKEGKSIPMEMNSNKLRDEYYLSIMRDLSSRKKAEEALKKQNEEYAKLNKAYVSTNKKLLKAKIKAEESDRLKSAFLANMSHEIRTPMNAIIGFSYTLSKPNLSPEKRADYTQIINNSCQQLLRIVNDVIDISKIEIGQIDLNVHEIDALKLIDSICAVYKPLAIKQHLTFHSFIDDSMEGFIFRGDETKLRQIIENLLSNALKFTNEGKIELHAKKTENKFIIAVKDSGIGMSKQQQKVIFERFRQLETENNLKHKGTGLGLSISKAYISKMKGEIWVESKKSVGSSFYFSIPIQTAKDEKKH